MIWALDRPFRLLLLAVALAAAACGPSRPPEPKTLGEAYVLPEKLHLRPEIPLTSGISATVTQGEQVEIIGRRRRFVRVRASEGREGWTEQNQLLTPEMFEHIRRVADEAAKMPRLGMYRARAVLNVHIDPYRWSPTIYQLKEEEEVDLLGRRVVERVPEPPAGTPVPASAAPPTGKTYPLDEWCFVRTREARAGWVLGRMIYAGIPDEVAQYAERQRITSYYPLGEVSDRGEQKTVWLWTTTRNTLAPYDFESFRVFNWSRSRHRYETALIERGLKGYFPVIITPATDTRLGAGTAFSFEIEKEDGQRYIRRYVMLGHLVRRYAEDPAALPPAAPAPAPAEEPPESDGSHPGFFRRLWERFVS
jgi:hypothetical protein